MKKGVRKNQIIIAALAVMIIVAGYLNFKTGGMKAEESSVITNVTTEGEVLDLTDENADIHVAADDEQAVADAGETAAEASEEGEAAEDTGETEVIEDVGEAVLTSTAAGQNFSASAKLNREQMRSKNKQALLDIIDNANVTEELKQTAMEDLMAMTDRSEMEVAAETLLSAKGFENAVVSLTETSCDVVICQESLTDEEKAQIEDIIQRKTDMGTESIVITTLN
ncbi:MAG TPA: SpoIIIAH-like family protein [Candidatus Onthocola gallistercoris]|uniref:SpoIIIAH-like family protein n=1 Tax=Candidatus Onthocola gallistercoris TaxID=2840876 RepID=A0A9D1HGB3_9FIRM|nr:SpoIIIAH-like family protein [Candidatus Onthocola gallistercoris]